MMSLYCKSTCTYKCIHEHVGKNIYIYKCICKCLRVFLSINYIYAYVYCFTCV